MTESTDGRGPGPPWRTLLWRTLLPPGVRWPMVSGAAVAIAAGLACVGGFAAVGWWVAESPGQVRPNLSSAGFLASTAAAGTALGALILRHRPGHGVGRVLLTTGLVGCCGVVALGWSGWSPAAWLAQWIWWPAMALIPMALLLFPDGRLPSRAWWPPLALLIAGVVVGSAALAGAVALGPRDLLLDISTTAVGTARLLLLVAAVAIGVWGLGVFATLAALARRWRRATPIERRQLLCLLVAGAGLLIGYSLELFGLSVAWLVQGTALPVGMTLAVLRFGLLDLDVVLNRATLWLTMTVVVLFGYVALVEIASRLLRPGAQPGGDRTAVLLLIGLVAITFEPLRRLVQRGVDRLFFGRRDDPYAVISVLATLLADVVDPAAVLPRLTTEVTRALQVPYAAVEVTIPGGSREVIACSGRQLVAPEPFHMIVHGERVGRLLVSPRRHGEHFTGIERRLLTDLARQAATAVQTYLLTLDLRRSRERLVMAREEERRRLRIELHDGLGPGLVGTALQVHAARQQLPPGSGSATILNQVADDLDTCAREAFRLVDDLRPAALDHGLAAALHQEAARFSAGGLRVVVDIPAEIGPLPAAVDVAIYRIVAEALANVARHAEARHCRVSMLVGDRIELIIEDDGVGRHSAADASTVGSGVGLGSSAGLGSGTGLDSMRHRAEELGGTFTLLDRTRPTPAHDEPVGLQIAVTLPLPNRDKEIVSG